MADDDPRVPAGWYPDPLGLPQLRWWDNHAWTEHVSDARQPMVAQETIATQKVAFADDEPSSRYDDYDEVRSGSFGTPQTAQSAYADRTGSLPTQFAEPDDGLSRRERRERERLETDEGSDAGQPATQRKLGDPLLALDAPRGGLSTEEPSPAVRYAATGLLEDAPTSAPFDLDTRYDDLLGTPSVPRSSFAHIGEGQSSYIPEFAAEPVTPTTPTLSRQQQLAMVDLPVATGPAWLMTLTPLYTLVAGLLVLLSGAAGQSALVVNIAIFGVPYVAAIVLAILDRSMLKKAGYQHPAHWAWAFAGALVYLVVRLTYTIRETGRGFGPLFTWLVLAGITGAAVLAVPGLIIQLAPATFSHEAEVSVQSDASILGTTLNVTCPTVPPLQVHQTMKCAASDPVKGKTYDVSVSLQRVNGWISWRVDNWGVFSMSQG